MYSSYRAGKKFYADADAEADADANGIRPKKEYLPHSSVRGDTCISFIDSLNQVIGKLMFELDVVLISLIYVCKAFRREINTPAHLRHCQDSSEVKSRHLSPLCLRYPTPRKGRSFK